MWWLLCFLVAPAVLAQDVENLQGEIAAAYVPCTESVHCATLYQLNEDIAADKITANKSPINPLGRLFNIK